MELQNQYSWLNVEVILKEPEDKAEFVLEIEALVREWLKAKYIESFHIKHSRYLIGLRVRFAGSEQGIQKIRPQLIDQLNQNRRIQKVTEIDSKTENCTRCP